MSGKKGAAAAKKVRYIVLDIDGVLTDNRIIIGSDGTEYKNFSVKDGTGITLARYAGFKFAIISGRYSKVIDIRARELKIDEVYQGVHVKSEAYEDLKKKAGLKDEEICFVGDEIIDIPLLEKCGFAACPSDAVPEVKKVCRLITKQKGGYGAVREVIEAVLKSQGLWQKAVNRYLRYEK